MRYRALLCALALSGCAGCADATYDKIRIGQQPQEYEKLLEADASRKTDIGRTYFRTDALGRIDAMVVLVARDQRVCGKIHVTRRERNTMSPTFALQTVVDFRLRAEIDPRLADMAATGPLDALRAIIVDLTGYQGERLAMDAHGWASAGLLRLIQRWPHSGEPPAAAPRVKDLLEKIPLNGVARLSVDEKGVYGVEYLAGEFR